MVRPMKFDRNAAIDTALQTIWRDGYGEASVKSLSATLGITRSSFYNAFGSREALFKLVLERYITVIPEAELFALSKDDPLSPALTRVVRKACQVRGNDPERRGCLAANAIAEILPTEDAAGEVVRELALATLSHLEKLVEWAKDRGEVDQMAVSRDLALAIHGMIMGLNLQSKFVVDASELWRSARTSLRALGLLSEVA